MVDSNKENDTQETAQLMEENNDKQQIAIPRIVLTEAPPIEQEKALESAISNTTSQSLSPTQSTHRKPISSTNVSMPLPLTKDLLRRKNKIEKLLNRQEKQSYKPPNPLGISYPEETAIDERIGLDPSPSSRSGGLRRRRLSSSHNELRSGTASNTLVNHPPEWQHDVHRSFNTTATESSNYKSKHAGTSVSGTSHRHNNASSNNDKLYKHHRYIDQHHNDRYYRQLQQERLNKNSQKSKYYLLEVLFNAAKRVVHSRVSETKGISSIEDFSLFSVAPSSPYKDRPTENPPMYSSSPNLKKSASPIITNSNRSTHRLSWLSNSTSNTNAEDDNNSIWHAFTKEESYIPQTETIPPPQNRTFPEEHVPINPLQGCSLYLFNPTNWLRVKIWLFIRSKYTESFLLCLLILHWFLLACVPITSNEQKSVFGNQWVHFAILFIQVMYSLEAICKMIAYGLLLPPVSSKSDKKPCAWLNTWLYSPKNIEEEKIPSNKHSPFIFHKDNNKLGSNHRAYLNSFGNILDIISILSYWADFILMGYGYPNMSLFKTLGALRPIRLLSIIPGTAMILESLELSWDVLLAVSGLILFFLILFALLGLVSFQGAFSRRCYYIGNDGSLMQIEPVRYCSGYRNGTSVMGPYNIQTGTHDYYGRHGYMCVSGQMCVEDPNNNPQYNFVNYDNIFSSLLSVYTFVSLELWTDLMYQTQDADSSIAALYYCLGVYIISFVMSFLLFAVITSAFARVRQFGSGSAFTSKEKGYLILRDTEEANTNEDNDPIWMFDYHRDDFRKGLSTLKLRWLLVHLVRSQAFYYFGGFLVLLDLIFMCLRSYTASESRIELINNAETAFTFIFAIEIVIRMVGATSWMNFWSSKRNVIDLFIAITTCVIQLPMIQDSAAYKYLTIFQICRCYRLFLCIPRVQRLVLAALGTGENVFNVMVFLILATALCATMFMQMFGGDFNDLFSYTDAANRFDTFWQSFVSLIIVYTSETWTEILYNAMASQAGKGSIYAAIALSIYFAFGRYIMSGLYIAVVLENFELSDDYIRRYQIKDYIHRHRFKDFGKTETILMKIFYPLYHLEDKKNLHVPKLPANLTASLSKADITELLADIPRTRRNAIINATGPSVLEKKFVSLYTKVRANMPLLKKEENAKPTPSSTFVLDNDDTPDDYDIVASEENREAMKERATIAHSLLIFSDRSRIRYYCKKLVGSSVDGQAEKRNLFNWIIMICVFVSIIMVILDEPSTRMIRKDTIRQSTYNTIEIALSIIFIIELIIRIIADGLLLTPNAYLRNHWNQLDICVILLNTITIFMGTEQAPRGLSTLRSLRILRLIRYFNGIRDIFVSLFYSFPLMLDALIFTLLVLIPFAVYGVNIFGGLMWLCNDDSVLSRGECIGEFTNNIGDDDPSPSILIPRVWQNPQNGFYSYDNFPSALQHLFSLTSTEGWVDSMFSAMSTPIEPDIQPSFDWNSATVYHGLFYIIFMIISQGTIQLFVGVIIEKFKERSGITTLTTAQRQYCDLQRMLANVKPTIKVFPPQSKIRRFCYDLVIEKDGMFNKVMMSVIILNACLLASEFQNEPDWLSYVQEYSYLIFSIIYVIECVIKFLGLGPKKWMRSKWCWYDCSVAFGALLSMCLRFALPTLWSFRVERYCLLLAAFRLGEGIDFLETLYHTLAKSLLSIIQVSAVFMVVMCLFAMIFMEFFGLTKYGTYGSRHTNFRDYGNALLYLVRFTTGEAWNAIIIDYAVQYPNCNHSSNYLENDCGSSFWAYVLFDAFYIICAHIFMNLFTAVIISNFEYTYETRTRFTKVTKSDLRTFKQSWADLDPQGTGYIQKEDVPKLLHKLTGCFQFRIYDDEMGIGNIIKHSKLNQSTSEGTDATSYDEKHFEQKNTEVDVNELNKYLDKMNTEETRRRRFEYNILVKEILRAETSKGISFDNVLTILSYRLIDISTALTLDPLISRLEMLEQLTQEYHLEKAAGFFLSQIQKRRFTHALWKKRTEDEVQNLGVTSTSQFDFGSPRIGQNNQFLDTPKEKKKRSPPVPRIVINTVPTIETTSSSPTTAAGTVSFPVSPMSVFSTDVHYTPSGSPGGAPDSLSVAIGTNSSPSSPYAEFDFSGGRSPRSSGFSMHSPVPSGLSPTSLRQNWLLMDANADMPTEISDGLMDSMNHNIWAGMLKEESTL